MSQGAGQLERAGTYAKRQLGRVKVHDSVLSVKPPVEIEMTNMAAAGVQKGRGLLPSRAQLGAFAKSLGITAVAALTRCCSNTG